MPGKSDVSATARHVAGLSWTKQLSSQSGPSEDLLALDEALARLARKEPTKAALVKLRYFAGLSLDEAAEALGISRATAKRYWTYARAWLYSQLNPEENDRPS